MKARAKTDRKSAPATATHPGEAKNDVSRKADRSTAPVADTEECILVLQGGGAFGAYQAGVFETLAAMDRTPHWVAGISIGAINAALIAGNPPERRVERLREFWELVSSSPLATPRLPPALHGLGGVREIVNETNATLAMLFGVAGFFTPRLPAAPFQPPGTTAAISFYDTEPLRLTLERLIDFDLLNSGKVRLSMGAVNVVNGNFRYFDTTQSGRLDARHIMASGALPPGFAPIEIDHEFYWDGGLVSNTPLQYVLDQPGHKARLVFQVDLFAARGLMPTTLGRGRRTREGHPLLEPDPPQHLVRVETPGDPTGGAPPGRQAAESIARRSRREGADRVAGRGGRLGRPSYLSKQALREPVEGLRVLARLDARALVCRYGRHASDPG